MTATYVTAAELRTNLGIGTLYPEAMIEEICQTAEDLCNTFLWYDTAPVTSARIVSNVATLSLIGATTPRHYFGNRPNRFWQNHHFVCGATNTRRHTQQHHDGGRSD